MEYCPECGTRVRPDVTYCHGCGKDLREHREWAASAEVDADDAATAGPGVTSDDPGTRRTDRSTADEADGGAGDGTDAESGAERDRDRQTGPQTGDRSGRSETATRNAGGRREHRTGRQAGSRSDGASAAARPGRSGREQAGPGDRSGPNDERPVAAGERAQTPATGTVADRGPTLTDRVAALPLKRSAGVGAGLAVVSYLATYLAFAVDALVVHGGDHSLGPTNLLPLTDVAAGSSQQMWELAAWLFYAGHNVPIERPAAGGSEVVDVLASGYWTQFTVPRLVTPALYTLVPLAVLVAGGAAYARRYGGDTHDDVESDAALLGASVLVGYAGVAAAGTTLVGVAEGGASTGPPLVDAALWTGLFAGGAGAVGGVASRRFGDDAAGRGAVSGTGPDAADATTPGDDAESPTEAVPESGDDAPRPSDGSADGDDAATNRVGAVDAASADGDTGAGDPQGGGSADDER
jgi:hypothetical protein